MRDQRAKIVQTAEAFRQEIWELAVAIGNRPEEGYKEFFAHNLLTRYLKDKGFSIETPLADIDTAFYAAANSNKSYPKIAFLAEYDALPGIGHACGHNLIGAASAGAAVVLSQMPELEGEIVVVGSPAEETSGAKVTLAQQGIFNGIDAAMMFHPGSCNVPDISSLALDAVEITYLGRAAHMAISDNVGINALEALIGLFHRVNKLKRKLAKNERIDGIIVEGGKAPNVVPDKAVAQFYLRAGKRSNLDEIRQRFLQEAQRSAFEVGAKMSWRYYECSYHEMMTNSTLANCFQDNLQYMGVKDIEPPQTMLGSVDMGNVSQVVPAIHPYLRLGKGLEIPHTLEFARAVMSEEGEKVLSMAVKSLALTGWAVLTDLELQDKIKKEFARSKAYA